MSSRYYLMLKSKSGTWYLSDTSYINILFQKKATFLTFKQMYSRRLHSKKIQTWTWMQYIIFIVKYSISSLNINITYLKLEIYISTTWFHLLLSSTLSSFQIWQTYLSISKRRISCFYIFLWRSGTFEM